MYPLPVAGIRESSWMGKATQCLNMRPMFRDALRSVGSRELLSSQEILDSTPNAMGSVLALVRASNT